MIARMVRACAAATARAALSSAASVSTCARLACLACLVMRQAALEGAHTRMQRRMTALGAPPAPASAVLAPAVLAPFWPSGCYK